MQTFLLSFKNFEIVFNDDDVVNINIDDERDVDYDDVACHLHNQCSAHDAINNKFFSSLIITNDKNQIETFYDYKI